MLMVFVNDIHSRPPCLISNLEETLHTYLTNSLNYVPANNSSLKVSFYIYILAQQLALTSVAFKKIVAFIFLMNLQK